MFTLGYPFRPWTRRRRIADGPSILDYVRDTAREYGIDQQHPLRAPGRPAPSGTPTTRRWTVDVETTDDGERAAHDLRLPLCLHRLLRLRRRATRRSFAGIDRFRGTDRPPAALAGGPRLRRQAGRRHRQRRHRGDAGARHGRPAPRTSRCCSARPSYVLSLPARDPSRRPAAARCCPSGRRTPLIRWKNIAHRDRALPALPAPAASSRTSLLRRRPPKQLPEGYDVDTHFKPALRPVGPAAVPGAGRRPVPGASAAAAPTWSPTPIDTFTDDRRPPGVRDGARRRHRRHRHRAEPAAVRRDPARRRRRRRWTCRRPWPTGR